MAVLDHVTPVHSNPLGRLGLRIWEALVSIAEAQARTEEVQFYNKMSDEELAARGLRRDEIVRHVFRDQIFI